MKTAAKPIGSRTAATASRGGARAAASRSAAGPASLRIQARLRVPRLRAPDPYEDEAEVLADWLCDRGNRPFEAVPAVSSVHDGAGRWGIAPGPELAARVGAARASGGMPLEPEIRAEFEAGLGVGLGHVRVHRDATSACLAAESEALAFTSGAHVFLGEGMSRAPRAEQRRLLAHEIVHVVQQTGAGEGARGPAPAPARVQRAFDHASTELDPKVVLLLDLHLRNHGGKLKEVGETVAKAGSWFADFRKALEPPVTPAGTPVDARARAKLVTSQLATAEGQIRAHASSATDAASQRESNQVQNALAGLVIDYLQINDAPAEAASFLARFPYAKTILHVVDTSEALVKREDFGAKLVQLVQSQWTVARAGAKSGEKESWSEEIVAVLGEFLATPPLPGFRKAREAMVARLKKPLGLDAPPGSVASADAFGTLDGTVTTPRSPLAAMATLVLEFSRRLAAGLVQYSLDQETAAPGDGPFRRWDVDVSRLDEYARRLGTTQSFSGTLIAEAAADPGKTPLVRRDLAAVQAAMVAAEKSAPSGGESYADRLRREVQPHVEFWVRLGQIAGPDLDPARHPDLAKRMKEAGFETLGPHFFAAQSGALARAVANVVPDLRDVLDDYLKTGVVTAQAEDPESRRPDRLFARHRDAAVSFHDELGRLLIPVTDAFAAARKEGDAERVDALGWFGMQLYLAQQRLDGVPANATPKTETRDLIGHGEVYWRIAAHFLALARAAQGRAPDKPPAKDAGPSASTPQRARWVEIEQLAERALRAEFFGTSLLVVTRPVEPSSDSAPTRLVDDAGGDRIGGLEPFTGTQLSIFYQAEYQRRLGEQLAALSDQAAKAAEPRGTDQLWLVSQAVEAVDKATGNDALPKRYESTGAYWIANAQDPPDALEDLFRASAPFREWERALIDDAPKGTDRVRLVIRASSDLRPDLYVWDLPKPVGLVKRLHDLPVLRGIVAMSADAFELHAAGLRPPAASGPAPAAPPPLDAVLLREFLDAALALGAKLPPETPADPLAWYIDLRNRLDAIRAGAATEILGAEEFRGYARRQATEDLKSERSRARTRTNVEMRRATTLDRGVIQRANLALLEEAIDEPIARMPAIGEAFENMAAFHAAARPGSDRERTLQTAALVIELLPQLLEIFGEDDPIGSYKDDAYYFLSLTLNALDELLVARPKEEPDPVADPTGAMLLQERHSEGILWQDDTQRQTHEAAKSDRAAKIQAVLDRLLAGLRPLQWELSIAADAASGLLYSHLGEGKWEVPSAPVVEARNRDLVAKDPNATPEPDFIEFGGFRVRILQVLQSFTFFPGIGDQDRAGNSKSRGGARYLPARLVVGRALHQAPAAGAALPDLRAVEDPRAIPPVVMQGADVPLVRVEVLQGAKAVSEPFDIMASDFGTQTSGIDWLAHIVHGRALQLNFERLGQAVDTFGQLLLFAASFHPIGAAVITGAELALLLTDSDLKAQLDAIAKDPKETLERFKTEIAAVFEPDRLFDLAMNGNFEAPDFARLTAARPGRKAFGGKTVARLLARVRRIAGAVALRLDAFQEAAQRPVRATQGELAQHPRLAAITHWAGETVAESGDLEGRVLRHPVAGPIYEAYVRYRMAQAAGSEADAFAALTQPVGQLATGVQEGLAAMKKVELPATIIPIPLALDALVELLLVAAKRGKGRLRIAAALADALKKGADQAGISSILFEKFGSWIQEIGADPNKLWQETLLPPLQAKVTSAIGDAATQIETVARRTPLLGDYLGQGRFASDARRRGQGVSWPTTDAGGASVVASTDHDGAFDHPRVAEWTPEEAAEDVSQVPSYATISKMPDVFFKNLKKPEPPGVGSGPDPAASGGAPPEASPHPDPTANDPDATATPRPSSVSSRGEPLPPGLRSSAQCRFGHDFSHVRLHRDTGANTLAAQAGASALTSGSHVFLGRGVDPASGTGARVFDHELAHVLQKEGPRPLGHSHGARSALGTPGGGLRWSAGEERAADAMAAQARSRPASGAGSVPVSVAGAHRSGFSPSLKGELIGDFLERISSPGTGASLAKRAEKAHARADAEDLDDQVRDAGRHLWSLLSEKFRTRQVGVDAPFGGAKDLLFGHLDDRLGTLREGTGASESSIPAISKVIDHLALGRQTDDPSAPKTKAVKGQPAAAVPQILDAKGFLVDVGLYLAARSGLVFDIDPPRTLNATLKKDPSAAVKLDVQLRHVELHFVNNRSDNGRAIWTKAIENTWPKVQKIEGHWNVVRALLARRFGAPPPAVAVSPGPTPAAALSKDDRLATGGFQPIWDSGAANLQFNKSFLHDVEVELNPPLLGPDLLAPWPIYVGRDRAKKYGSASVQDAVSALQKDKHFKGTTPDRTARIGIHLASHGELTNTDSKKPTYGLSDNDRESHHVVQYLLPEYFSNDKDTFKPFPDLGTKKYPGVVPDAAGVKSVGSKADGTGEVIQVRDTESPGRGNPMPAILLSARAHQNSGLHVTPQPDEEGSASQGFAIHRKFEEFLLAEVKLAAPATATAAAATAWLQARPDDDTAARRVHDAVQRTAGWLWNVEMKDALLKTMPGVEASYYLGQFNLAPAASASGGAAPPAGAAPAAAGKSPLLAQLHGGTEPDHATIEAAIAVRANEAATWAIDELTKNKGWKFPAS